MMSKKVYVQFAKMINQELEDIIDNEWDLDVRKHYQSATRDITLKMLDIFYDDNPNFDRERFLKACGLGE